MCISVKDWNVWFGASHILKDINLEFQKNRISAIVGPSGCGKTTFLKSMNRTAELEDGFSHSGKITLSGEEIYEKKNAADIRRRIGMVFQTPIALPLSIKENVLFEPRYYGMGNLRYGQQEKVR